MTTARGMALKVGSLFAGIGGFDLGLERAGMEVRWQVEIDPYCNRVLAKHWPTVPRYGDIRTMDWGAVEPVDVLCGGFPCQDLSFAGKRAGIDGERSGLWSEYLRAIVSLRPRYVIVENVPGLLTNEYMGRVLGDLAQSGYDAEWDCIPASAVGAPHRRDRVWIVAHTAGGSMEKRPMAFLQELQKQSGGVGWKALPGTHWETHQPSMVGVAHGVSQRMAQLAAIGNAIVPQIAEALGRMILRSEQEVA